MTILYVASFDLPWSSLLDGADSESKNPFRWSSLSPSLRRTIWANIFLALLTLILVVGIQSRTSSVWDLVGASIMGTVYTITARSRAKVVVLLYFAVVGAILVAMYPYIH